MTAFGWTVVILSILSVATILLVAYGLFSISQKENELMKRLMEDAEEND